MSDTGTDWAAVRLDLLAHAAAMKDNLAEYQRLGDTDLAAACEHSIAMHELAAVGLRRLAQLDTAISDQEVDLCAICGEVYCSGAGCLHDMVDELPDDYQECGEKIERVQDLVRLGRILSEWRSAAVLGSKEQPERTEP